LALCPFGFQRIGAVAFKALNVRGPSPPGGGARIQECPAVGASRVVRPGPCHDSDSGSENSSIKKASGIWCVLARKGVGWRACVLAEFGRQQIQIEPLATKPIHAN